MSSCRSCGASIRWERTLNGKRIPLDADPHREGNVDVVFIGGEQVALVLGAENAVAAQASGHQLFLSHFVTCPNAASHRRAPSPRTSGGQLAEGKRHCD